MQISFQKCDSDKGYSREEGCKQGVFIPNWSDLSPVQMVKKLIYLLSFVFKNEQ